MRRQVVPGDGGAEEGEVKVKLFLKKSCRVKGGGWCKLYVLNSLRIQEVFFLGI